MKEKIIIWLSTHKELAQLFQLQFAFLELTWKAEKHFFEEIANSHNKKKEKNYSFRVEDS